MPQAEKTSQPQGPGQPGPCFRFGLATAMRDRAALLAVLFAAGCGASPEENARTGGAGADAGIITADGGNGPAEQDAGNSGTEGLEGTAGGLSGEGAELPVADAGAGGSGGSGANADASTPDVQCECTGETACCDGCFAQREGNACDELGSGGYCRRGECRAYGDVGEILLGNSGTEPWVQNLAWSPGGKFIVVASEGAVDGTLPGGAAEIMNVETGAPDYVFSENTFDAAYAPGGKFVALGGAAITIVNPVSGAAAAGITGASGAVVFSPDGAHLAAGTAMGFAIHETVSWQPILEILLGEGGDTGARLWDLAYSPDGQVVASCRGQTSMGPPAGELALWDAASGAEIHKMACSCLGAAFAPDGQTIAAACWDFVTLWDTKTGAVIASRDDVATAISVAWLPDGKYLAVGHFSGGVEIHRTADFSEAREPVVILPVLGGKALAFEPGASRLAVGVWKDPALRIWRFESALPP